MFCKFIIWFCCNKFANSLLIYHGSKTQSASERQKNIYLYMTTYNALERDKLNIYWWNVNKRMMHVKCLDVDCDQYTWKLTTFQYTKMKNNTVFFCMAPNNHWSIFRKNICKKKFQTFILCPLKYQTSHRNVGMCFVGKSLKAQRHFMQQ